MPRPPTVLCLFDRRRNPLATLLQGAGWNVLYTLTADHAVAICAQRRPEAALLDQNFFVEVESWSIAQSIKLVAPGVCVLLVVHGELLGGKPKGVDSIVRFGDNDKILEALNKLNHPFWTPSKPIL